MFKPLEDDLVAGIDEVGRGSLAGPIVAAAALFRYTESAPISGLKDSKKFSNEKVREAVAHRIVKSPLLLQVSFGIVNVEEINRNGIEAANRLIFQQALNGLREIPRWVYVDGTHPVGGFPIDQQLVEPRADGKYWFVSAASILAKVYRDDLMIRLADEHPQYDWKNNKGYGSQKHITGLLEHGPCEHHRSKFISNYV